VNERKHIVQSRPCGADGSRFGRRTMRLSGNGKAGVSRRTLGEKAAAAARKLQCLPGDR